MTYEIIPGILENSQNIFQERFKLAAQFAKTIQVDIIDDEFAGRIVQPDLSFTKNYNTALELHLMVKNPQEWIDSFPSLNIKRLIGHVELMDSIPKFIDQAKNRGTEPFLGIDLPTDVSLYAKHEYIERGLKGFLIMTVKAGHSGQEFDLTALDKVAQIRQKFPDTNIEIDGGVNKDNIEKSIAKGVNLFATTSAIFQSNDAELEYGLLSALLPSRT